MALRPYSRVLAAAVAAGALALLGAAADAPARGTSGPANNGTPTISGTAEEGQTVTGHNGSWFCDPACEPSGPDNRGGYEFQWQRCDASGAGCANIAGADEQDYVVQAADRGSTLRVAVTATNYDCNAHGVDCRYSSATAFSSVTSVVPGAPPFTPPPPPPDPDFTPPVSMALPVAAGLAREGESMTASTGDWTGAKPIGYVYQWKRCAGAAGDAGACASIPGAVTTSYTVVAADVGSALRVTVTATNALGSSSATSAPTEVVVAVPSIVPESMSPPAVFGLAKEGLTLTAAPGSWSASPAPTFSFSWLRCGRDGRPCLPIAGAERSTYRTTAADGGRTLVVVVTATNASGSATATSPPTAVVEPKGVLHLLDGRESVPANGVLFPDGLRIDSARFTTRDGRTIRGTLHVSDTRGYVVRGALVSLRPVRKGDASASGQRSTSVDGTVRIVFTLSSRKRASGGTLTLVVRATKRGDSPSHSIAHNLRVTLRLRPRG